MIIIKFFTQINQNNCDAFTTLFEFNFLKYAHRLKIKNLVLLRKINWEYGGTGRRAGFKIRSLRWCGFDSLYSYQSELSNDDISKTL